MVYESGFTTRRTYSSRPVVSSYNVSRKLPIDWEKYPSVPRPTLIADPVTAFGKYKHEREVRKNYILDPKNVAAIRPTYHVLHEPIMPYVPARDKNRERIFGMARKYIDAVEAGGNTATRTFRNSLDTVLPLLHHAATQTVPRNVTTLYDYRNDMSPETLYGGKVKREVIVNEKTGATITRYYC